jgi:hypothetical protein
VIDKDKFLSLYNNNLNDHEIGERLDVSHDTVRRYRIKLDLEPAQTRVKSKASNNVVLSACSEAEHILRDKSEDYRKGFEDGARWRLQLSETLTNQRKLSLVNGRY